MDTEHRHELKENDLAHFLDRVGPWWKRHGFKTMVVVLVVVLAVVITRTSKQRATAEHDKTWSQLGTASSPNEFLELTLDLKDPAARALAYLKGAAAYNLRASLPNMGEAPGSAAPANEEDRTDSLERAAKMVKTLLASSDTPTLIRLNAMLLGAAIEENRGDFDAAAKQYQALIDDPDTEKEPAIRKRAEFRITMLPDLQLPQPFSPDPDEALPSPDADGLPATDEPETNTLMTTPPVPVDAGAENDDDGP